MILQNFRKRCIPWYYLHQASSRKNQRNYKENYQEDECPSSKDSSKSALETKPPTKMVHPHLEREKGAVCLNQNHKFSYHGVVFQSLGLS